MSTFRAYGTATHGLQMDYANFGFSYMGEYSTLVSDVANGRGGYTLTSYVYGNPEVWTYQADYYYVDGTYWLEDNVRFYDAYNSLVFEATDLNLEITGISVEDFDFTAGFTIEAIVSEPDTFYGNNYADYIFAGLGDDVIHGNGGDDYLGGAEGSDWIDAGSGFDTAWYNSNRADYTITKNADGSFRVAGSLNGDGVDTVYNTEQFNFNGVIYNASELIPTVVAPPSPPQTNFTGTSGNNTLTGNSLNNTIKGLAGNDTLKGLAGTDKLYGGNGNDKLYGGAGSDYFVFDYKPNATTNKDAILDYIVADDTIWINNAIYTKAGANGTLASGAFRSNNTGKAADSSDRIIYDKDSGVLYYDADGSGYGASVAFATISKNLALTYKDFYCI